MNQISNQFLSIEQITDQYLNQSQNVKSKAIPSVPFEEILRQKQTENVMEQSGLKFSKHAALRLNDRNIALTDAQNIRLENGVRQASEKGITESLVLVDSLAFIVNFAVLFSVNLPKISKHPSDKDEYSANISTVLILKYVFKKSLKTTELAIASSSGCMCVIIHADFIPVKLFNFLYVFIILLYHIFYKNPSKNNKKMLLSHALC